MTDKTRQYMYCPGRYTKYQSKTGRFSFSDLEALKFDLKKKVG